MNARRTCTVNAPLKIASHEIGEPQIIQQLKLSTDRSTMTVKRMSNDDARICHDCRLCTFLAGSDGQGLCVTEV